MAAFVQWPNNTSAPQERNKSKKKPLDSQQDKKNNSSQELNLLKGASTLLRLRTESRKSSMKK
jgi:hypothetical protein